MAGVGGGFAGHRMPVCVPRLQGRGDCTSWDEEATLLCALTCGGEWPHGHWKGQGLWVSAEGSSPLSATRTQNTFSQTQELPLDTASKLGPPASQR